jgi:hypothetical protein
MKSTLAYLTISYLAINICIAQGIAPQYADRYNPFGLLYVLKLANGRTIQTENLIVDYEKIISAVRLTRFETVEQYGQITKAGAFVLTLKPNIQFRTFTQIFDQFHIRNEYRNLPVYIDSLYVEQPQTILAQQNMILSVDIIGKGTQKINIKTTYKPAKKNGSNTKLPEFYLQGSEVMGVDSFINSNK